MPKHSLREQMLEYRCRLTAETLQQLSDLVQRQFVELPEFLAASVVALYSPTRNEVATAELFRVGRQLKRLLFPRVFGKHLEFVEVSDWSELHSGAFGIAEPIGSPVVAAETIDLMVLPGLAFDRRGHRLGYGKGYYDRYWHQQPRHGLLLGLAFDFQVVDRLPVEHHDIQLDLLVTETSLLRFA